MQTLSEVISQKVCCSILGPPFYLDFSLVTNKILKEKFERGENIFR